MRTLTYAGKDFSEFSCWWDGSQVFEKPAKIAQNYQIPFRNGDLIRSTEAFENVQIRFNCFIKDNYEENYSELVNFLNSFDTYQRLETSAEPSIYRMAFLHAVIEPETGQFLKDGQFTIVFDCMPQEWLKSGEEEFSIDMQTNSYTGNPVTYVNEFGDSVVDNLTVEFEPQQDLNGYDYPWAGGAGKNKVDCAMLAPVTNKGVTMYSDPYGRIYLDGTATGDGSFTLATNFRLASGSYYLNGLADGAGMDSFYYSMSSGGAIIAYLSNDETVINGGTYSLYLDFVNGQVFNNTVFAPMIREVGTEPYFEPYENICPISGHTSATVQRTGKNILDYNNLEQAALNVGIAVDENGLVYDSSPTGDNRGWNYNSSNWKMALPAGTYTLTVTVTETSESGSSSFRGYKSDGSLLFASINAFLFQNGGTATRTFTLDEETDIGFEGKCYAAKYFVMLETGDTATDYEPYQGQIYAPSLGQTVYGGSLDLVSGVLTVKLSHINLGDLTWTYNSTNKYFVALGNSNQSIKNLITTRTSAGITEDVYCDSYFADEDFTTLGNISNGAFVLNTSKQSGSQNTLIVKDERFTDATAFKTAVDGVYFVAPLAEPTTVQLTPTQISLLQGTNIFSSDVSEVAITITEGTTLTNPSYMKARPLIILNGSGTGSVMLNGEEVVRIDVTPSNVPLYIDCETMDCYSIVNGETVNENRHVTLPEGYIELQKGDNRFTASGNLQPTMIPRWWRL